MAEWLTTPEMPGIPARRLSSTELRRRVKAMPYEWKRWDGTAGLFSRDDGSLIAGVKREELDRFLTGLVCHDDSTDLELRASGGEVVVVPAEDVVAFILAFMKVRCGG